MANGTSIPAALPASSGAHTYHVNFATGSDSNSGASGSPFQTLTKASTVAVAGDIILVHGPNYGTSGGDTTRDVWTASGTSGNPITITNAPGETVVTWRNLKINANYVILKGDKSSGGSFTFDRNNFGATTTLSGAMDASQTSAPITSWVFDTNGTAAFIKIDNEEMKITAGRRTSPGAATLTVIRGINGTTPAAHSSGATVKTGDSHIYVATVTGVDIVDMNFQKSAKNSIFTQYDSQSVQVRRCKMVNCGVDNQYDHGFYWEAPGDSRTAIIDCICSGAAAFGIQFYYGSGVVGQCLMTGCIFDGSVGKSGIIVNTGTGGADGAVNITIKNTYSTNNAEFGFRTNGGGIVSTGNTVDHCYGFGNAAGDVGGSGYANFNSVSVTHGDPHYNNRAAQDFTPTSTSAGISQADPPYASVTDFVGGTRDSTPDVGPYEYLPGGGGTIPVNTAIPSFTGTVKQGLSLTGNAGTWTGSPAPTLTYQWYRGNPSGLGMAAISGATSINYTVQAGDVGKTLKLRVTGTNASGSATADSRLSVLAKNTTNFGATSAQTRLPGGRTMGKTFKRSNYSGGFFGSVNKTANWPWDKPYPVKLWPPGTTPWTRTIPASVALSASSAAIMGFLSSNGAFTGAVLKMRVDGTPVVIEEGGSTVYTVSGSNNFSRWGGVPIPAGAVPDPGTRRCLVIFDAPNLREYSLRNAVYNAGADTWSADAGSAIDIAAGEIRTPVTGQAANAVGFPGAAGLVYPEDIQELAVIEHALVCFLPNAVVRNSFVYPALSGDGTITNTSAIPSGSILQLDPSVNVAGLSVASWEKTIATALQTYGMYVKGSTTDSFYIEGENPINRGSEIWTIGAGNSIGFSSGFPWSSLRVLVPPNTW